MFNFLMKVWDLRNTYSKISVFDIVIQHLKTLRKVGKTKFSFRDLFTFFITPLLISGYVVFRDLYIDKDTINTIIAALSILAGFLFNLLAIVFGLIDKIQANIAKDDDEYQREIKEIILKEVHSNISYCILISVITILFLLLCLYDFKSEEIFCYETEKCIIRLKFKVAVHFITYFLLINFLFSLLMVLKRVHILLKKEF